ncbi:reverse transcriptase domain-containing protein [Tanacetum coccineum]
MKKWVKVQKYQLIPITHPSLLNHHHPNLRGSKNLGSPKKNTKVSQPSGSTDNVPDENVPTTSNDPLLSGEDRLKLTELMDLCTNLQKKAFDLEKAKTAQDSEIASIKKKVKKLERRNKSRTPGLKMLRKGRKIADIDANAEVTLIDETQGRNDDNLIFDTGVLDEQEVKVEKVVSIAKVTTESATTTTVDELTLAQTLIEIKAAKPKVRRVMIQEPSEFTTTTTTTTPAASKPSQDKGKAKIIESEKPLKKKDQIMYDQELSIKEKSKLFIQLLEARKKHFAEIRAREKRNKPPTQAQQRKLYCNYLKNVEGYTLKQLKGFKFEVIKDMFDKAFKRVNTFVDYKIELVEGSEKRVEDSTKREGDELEQELTKKQKVADDKERKDLQQCFELVTEEDVAINAISLATKPAPIVNFQIHRKGRNGYYEIMRLVKAKQGNTRPEEGYERVLWGDLKTIVHFVRFEDMHVYMLVKKRYPLTPATITDMLNKKLKSDYWNEINGAKYRVRPPRYYTRIDNRLPFEEKRPSLEELMNKHLEESTRRRAEMEEWVKKLQENAEINTRNQSASLKNLETQIEQLTKEFHTKAANEINNSSFDHCKAVYADKKTPHDNGQHEVSFDNYTQIVQENVVSSKVLPCQLPQKEMNPGNFTLPCTIGSLNFYAMEDLGASVNVIPKTMFEHLKLAQLKKTDMLVEMADMTKRSPIGIVENIFVKIDKFLFPSDFVVMDMLNTRNETMILRRPFLATIHAETDVFNKEISLGIGGDREKNKCGGLSFPEFLLVKYEETQEKELIWDDRFGEWCNNNPNTPTSRFTTVQENLNPRSKDYPFKYWLLKKVGHTNVSEPVKKTLLKTWLIDCFREDLVKHPQERSFDDYKWMFDLEVDQLADEYELGIGKKGHMLDDIWENCSRYKEMEFEVSSTRFHMVARFCLGYAGKRDCSIDALQAFISCSHHSKRRAMLRGVFCFNSTLIS